MIRGKQGINTFRQDVFYSTAVYFELFNFKIK